MKKVLQTVLILMICIFAFSGCASVHYGVFLYDDGSIEQSFQMVLDKTVIEDSGYNFEDAKAEIRYQMQTIVDKYQTKLLLYCLETAQSPDDCGIELTGIQDVSDTSLYVSIKFESITVYKSFYNISQNGGSDGEETPDINVDGIFFTRDRTEIRTVYYNISEDEFVQDLLEYFSTSEVLTLSDIEFYFYYGTPSNKLYAENAFSYRQNDLTIHRWTLDASTLNDSVVIFTIEFHPVSWYLLALSLTAVLIVVLVIVSLYKKNKKNNKFPIVNNQ